MSPRRSAADAAATRALLLDRAAAMASLEGVEGMTLGRLAGASGLSKSGVTRHFPTKEELQLETLEHGFARFAAVVWAPVAGREPGIQRLRALCDSWCAFLASDTFPGGCFLTAVATELDARSGPVRDAAAAALARWLGVLAADARTAVAAGDLPADTDPDELAYRLNGLALVANQCRQLLGDEDAPARSNRMMVELLAAAV